MNKSMDKESAKDSKNIKVESSPLENEGEVNAASVDTDQADAEKRAEKEAVEANDTVQENTSESETVKDEESEGSTETAEDQKEETLTLEDKYNKLNDKYVRLLAEFENFKRRTNQEIQSRFKFATQSLALNIISGLDNLERAIDQAKVETENEQLKEFLTGIEMVQQQLHEAFEKNNIERLDPKGEIFDPNKHEAMGIVETEDVQPDHVAEVFQPGYKLHDRVIRPAMVQVAKKK